MVVDRDVILFEPLTDDCINIPDRLSLVSIPALHTSDIFIDLTYAKQFSKFMDKMSKDINVPALTPHELRHTYGTLKRAAGVDIYTIQKVMGHADISITIPVPNSNTKPVAVHTDIHDEYKKVKRFSLVG